MTCAAGNPPLPPAPEAAPVRRGDGAAAGRAPAGPAAGGAQHRGLTPKLPRQGRRRVNGRCADMRGRACTACARKSATVRPSPSGSGGRDGVRGVPRQEFSDEENPACSPAPRTPFRPSCAAAEPQQPGLSHGFATQTQKCALPTSLLGIEVPADAGKCSRARRSPSRSPGYLRHKDGTG